MAYAIRSQFLNTHLTTVILLADHWLGAAEFARSVRGPDVSSRVIQPQETNARVLQK
jgi:hypothetical protein